jgi:hypothetical protein
MGGGDGFLEGEGEGEGLRSSRGRPAASCRPELLGSLLLLWLLRVALMWRKTSIRLGSESEKAAGGGELRMPAGGGLRMLPAAGGGGGGGGLW